MLRITAAADTLEALIFQLLEQVPELHDYFADLEGLRAEKDTLLEQLRQTRETIAALRGQA